jgi:formylglycine-generating enzyme required for sulfatase activity
MDEEEAIHRGSEAVLIRDILSWPNGGILTCLRSRLRTMLLRFPRCTRILLATTLIVSAAGGSVGGDDGAPMVVVTPGNFLMGSETGHEDEKPLHQVYLQAFFIDVYEVTVSRYAMFLESEEHEPPFLWAQDTKDDHGKKPVIGVDWYEARAYCRWAGKRLPTEAEREKAARGTDGRIYPWGNDIPTPLRAKYGEHTWKGYGTLASVGSLAAGKSPYGVYEMAGNAWEWVADRYEATYYQSGETLNPQGPFTGPLRVLRGGSWNNEAPILRTSNRSAYIPSGKRSDFGFRCARNA